jgi:hypothetical protein
MHVAIPPTSGMTGAAHTALAVTFTTISKGSNQHPESPKGGLGRPFSCAMLTPFDVFQKSFEGI